MKNTTTTISTRVSLSDVVMAAVAKIKADEASGRYDSTTRPHNLELVHVVEQLIAEIPDELDVP